MQSKHTVYIFFKLTARSYSGILGIPWRAIYLCRLISLSQVVKMSSGVKYFTGLLIVQLGTFLPLQFCCLTSSAHIPELKWHVIFFNVWLSTVLSMSMTPVHWNSKSTWNLIIIHFIIHTLLYIFFARVLILVHIWQNLPWHWFILDRPIMLIELWQIQR